MSSGILIVEDSLTVRMNLHEALETAGIPVDSCATLGEARRILAARDFGLVILDMLLPDGEGTELLTEIRTSSRLREISVMLLSTESQVQDRLKAMNMGADEYIGKPYDIDFVIARARELLQTNSPVTDAEAAAAMILVIDDSLTFRVALKHALERAGYKVLTAESGEAGLRLAGQVRPSALIVDGIMDGIDGATVIRRIRLDAALRHIPCLLLTGSEGKSAEIEALEAGADAFVVKSEDTSLVLARLSAIMRSAESSGKQITASLQAPKRVLAVDDSETYLQELASSLRGEGYDVILARSGEEALDLLAVQQVDCILLDLVMPGLGGHEVCRRLKANPLTRHIPVLILTAREDQESTIEGLSAGADDYIAKSSEFQVLRARVLAQLRRKQFEDENRHTREQLLQRELEAAEARAARQLVEARSALVEQDKVRAEASEKAKSAFLAAMSHEIRTPMNGVIGIVELLSATTLTEEQRQMVEIIRRSGVTLLDVINSILDHSKLEIGGMTLERTSFSLIDTIETTAQLVAAQAQSKPVELICYIDPAIDETLLGDPVRVRQIALNLLGNAVKFTERGSVRMEVMAESFSADEVVVLFEVRDTGIGMTQEEQDRLFRPYQQANEATTRKYGGTGLGLSICKNLVELMGGRIGIRSTVGHGSTFWFRVTFGRSEQPGPAINYTRALSQLRVLVFCPKGQATTSLYLRAKEVEVRECSDFEECLKILEADVRAQQPMDLFVMHTGFDTKGKSLLKAVREHPLLRSTKCVVVEPHMSAAYASAPAGVHILSSPVRRAALYDLAAFITGRTEKRNVTTGRVDKWDFTAPSVEEARKAGALVLVAEDSKTNQFVVINQLKRLGIACEVANDGRDAWEMLQNPDAGYGLLLTDCHMPHTDGFKLTALVRDREIKTKGHLPIVALTANALSGEAETCRASGMDDYLSKPTTLDALDAMFKKWLPGAIQLRQIEEKQSAESLPTAKSDSDPIDLERFSAMIQDTDSTLIRQMLALYRETEGETGVKINNLIASGDASELARTAHTALGAARTAYAKRLADLCEDLERAARLPDWSEIKLLRPHVEAELQNVMMFIDKYLDERTRAH